jgi:hypothetical protein
VKRWYVIAVAFDVIAVAFVAMNVSLLVYDLRPAFTAPPRQGDRVRWHCSRGEWGGEQVSGEVILDRDGRGEAVLPFANFPLTGTPLCIAVDIDSDRTVLTLLKDSGKNGGKILFFRLPIEVHRDEEKDKTTVTL